jgi:anti-anti-sigma factor
VLSIDGYREGDRHTLLLRGELDMVGAPELEARAQQLCANHASELVLDLSQLEFIDSAGLNSILHVRALCQEHMCEFCLTPGARPVQRLFEVTRLIDRLPFRKSRRGERPGSHATGHDASPQASTSESEPES